MASGPHCVVQRPAAAGASDIRPRTSSQEILHNLDVALLGRKVKGREAQRVPLLAISCRLPSLGTPWRRLETALAPPHGGVVLQEEGHHLAPAVESCQVEGGPPPAVFGAVIAPPPQQ